MKTKKIIYCICSSFLFISCNLVQEKVIDPLIELQNDYTHYKILNSTTKIIIEFESNQDSIVPNEIEKYETVNSSQVNDFKKLFENNTKTSYCCCPAENYSILFYNKDHYLDYYLVDTLEFKNQIRIYDVSYQYSYLIDKKIWQNYLKKISANMITNKNIEKF